VKRDFHVGTSLFFAVTASHTLNISILPNAHAAAILSKLAKIISAACV